MLSIGWDYLGDLSGAQQVMDTAGVHEFCDVRANTRTTATTLNNPNTIVLRDASGNFSNGNITANAVGVLTIAGNGSALRKMASDSK